MSEFEFATDRTIISTENNEYATGLRDENEAPVDLVEPYTVIDDIIPEAVHENGENPRPLYDENGNYRGRYGDYTTYVPDE